MQIGIIGGGAAGMMAAIQTQKADPAAKIYLFDANNTLGRKLRATGAGRCNISNQHASAERYFTDDAQILEECFYAMSNAEVLKCLENIGIPTIASTDGWIYPLSYSAANVVDILVSNLGNISIMHNTLIDDIQRKENGFLLGTADPHKKYAVDRLIIACGSPASPQLGGRAELYHTLAKLGHRILPVRPALTPVEIDPAPFHKLQGVRLDVGTHLWHREKEIAHTIGNIIITQWGLNGPGIMDISHYIDPEKVNEYLLYIDFAPQWGSAIQSTFQNPALAELSPATLLKGYFPAKIVDFLLKQTGLEEIKTSRDLSDKQKDHLWAAIHHQSIKIRGVRGFRYAQASTGGIALSEIKAPTMESSLCPGLFFAGEILNVLGPCGGFNLHWAFLSAILAAQGICRSQKSLKQD